MSRDVFNFLFSLLSLILGAGEVALDLRKFLISHSHARERHPSGGWYKVMGYTHNYVHKIGVETKLRMCQ